MNLETIGAGAGSGIIGVVLAFLGFKSRLDNIDRKLTNVVYKDTFEAVINGIQKQLETQTKLIERQGDDIKELLKK